MAELMVDIDEVVMATVDGVHQIAFERGLHDGSRPHEQWEGYLQYGCEPDLYWDCWSEFALRGGYLTTPPIPGAAEALRFLMWEGHKIHLVTARGFMAHAEQIRTWTKQWVEDFAIPHHSLTFARDKVGAQVELGVGFDGAVDDSPKNFVNLDVAGIDVYLMNHPHNASATGIPAERRVPNLWEWAYIIEKSRGNQ